jgi:tRNA threonylcarbamoyladenosine modification (KEOPS) complex  Pcc1 subunit
MSYSALIKVDDDGKIFECLKGESSAQARSSISISGKKSLLEVSIKASDAVSFRASINSITRLLSVYDKVARI